MIYQNLTYLCHMKNVIKIIIIAIVIAIAFFLSSCEKVEQDSTYIIEYDTFLGKNIYNLKQPVKDSNWYDIPKRVGSYRLRYILINVYWNDIYPIVPIKLKSLTQKTYNNAHTPPTYITIPNNLYHFKENNNYNLKKIHNYKNYVTFIIYTQKYTYIDDYIYPYNTYIFEINMYDFRVK